jgi:hypothetical protein
VTAKTVYGAIINSNLTFFLISLQTVMAVTPCVPKSPKYPGSQSISICPLTSLPSQSLPTQLSDLVLALPLALAFGLWFSALALALGPGTSPWP